MSFVQISWVGRSTRGDEVCACCQRQVQPGAFSSLPSIRSKPAILEISIGRLWRGGDFSVDIIITIKQQMGLSEFEQQMCYLECIVGTQKPAAEPVSPAGEAVFNVSGLSSVDLELHWTIWRICCSGIWFGSNLWWNSWPLILNSWSPISNNWPHILDPN